MAEIETLIEGYRRFHEKYFDKNEGLFQLLGLPEGQSPKTLVIACSDSRVDPSIITNAEPGDIFVIRNVANLVPPYQTGDSGLHGVSAALEFAVRVIQVKNIVVLGHSNCAGIRALMSNGLDKSDFIGKWVGIAQPAKDKAIKSCEAGGEGASIQHACEKEAIQLSLNNLRTFPWIRQKLDVGELSLHGWYFTLADGKLQCFNETENGFVGI